LSSHYRLGWVEKEKAGGSLVAPEVEHQYNMPEGMQYEHGKGLSGSPGAVSPAPTSPAPAGLPKALQGSKL
jgi:ferredoxin-type protein NapG